MFLWLESTAVARWVGESYYAYPVLLSLHIVGLAIVVGLFSMRDLKLLGLFPALDLENHFSLIRLAFGGFCLNLLSGVLLFSSQASYLVTSLPFLLKIACICFAMVVALLLHRRADKHAAPQILRTASHRILASLSLVLWSSAIIAGRLIAYV